MTDTNPKTVEQQMSAINKGHAERRDSGWRPTSLYDFVIPDDLLEAAAEYTCSDNNPPIAPPELTGLAASYGLVILMIDRGAIEFGRQLQLSDPIEMIANDLEAIGLQGIGIKTIADLVETLQDGFKILDCVDEGGYVELLMLYHDLRAQGFIT